MEKYIAVPLAFSSKSKPKASCPDSRGHRKTIRCPGLHSRMPSGPPDHPNEKAPPGRGATRAIPLGTPPVDQWSSCADSANASNTLPGTPLRRNDAGLPAELERPSDLRFDPTPSAKPTGEVLNPEKPLEHHGSRSRELHLEVVIEGHRAVLVRSVIR